MGDSTTITDLADDDLPTLGRLFAAHTGRPADLDTLHGWAADAPTAAARVDGHLVGYVVCRPFAPDLVELASFLVAPGVRGRGLGRRMVAHVEAAVVERGLGGIVVVTSDGYEVVGEKRSSRSLFEELGYHVVLETEITTVLGRTWRAR